MRFFHFSGFDWTKPDILSKWDRLCRGQDMPSAVSRLIEDYLGSLRSEEVERWSRVPSRLGLSGNYAIPDFLLDWLRRQPAFEAVARADWRDGDVEQALLEFFLLPDRTYPWLPIFLGRTLDSVPGLRETFPCESGFLVQDLATWFESVGRTALGFGSLFPSRGWWTEKTGVEMFLRQAEGTWGTRLQNWKIPPAFSTFAEDYLASLRSEAIERWRHTDARLWLSPRYAIPDFLRDWLLQQPSFEAAARADWQGGDIEQALLEFFLLPDRTYPWLPIFLGRTLDSVPGLRETFPCESGFLVQDLATWFESVGRMALGFGSLFPSRSWWTEERGLEKHLRRVVERWLRSKKSVVSRKTRFRLARSLRKRLAQRNREEQRTQISINGQPRIHVYGHFLQTNGLAETARSTVRALQQLGYPCRAIHVPDGSGAPELPGSLPLSLPGMDAEIAIIHTRWNELRRCLECHPELERFPKLRIAYWTAAFGDDPPVMGEAASLVEEIWCPSEFSAAAFRRATGRTVRVAWPNADIEQIEKRADRSIGIDLDLRGKCVFLVLADFSADPYRKNPLSALRAYLRAFPTLSSDRRLLLKLSNVERDPDYFQQLLTACSARPDVLTFQPVLPRPKMLGLLHAATALISLHASDSVGLPIAEMLSLGKPVVATAYGGNIEFRSPKDAGRVSYREAAVKGPDPVREGALRVEPLWEEAVPRLQAIYREWRQGDHREMRPDPWINERSFAMYAENLRAVEQLLRPASVELRSRPSCG